MWRRRSSVSGGGDRAALVVGHDPGRDAGVAEEPGRAVGGEQQAPGLVDSAREIALVGAHDRQARVGLGVSSIGRCWPICSGVRAPPAASRRCRDRRCATASGPSRSSRSLKSSPSRGGMAITTSRPFAAQPAGGGLGGPQAGTGCVVVGEDDDARDARRGSSTCSSPEVESVAQTGRPGHAVITARPVSMPSQSPSGGPRPMAPSRTAPPATVPSIMRGFATAALPTCPSACSREVRAVQADGLAVAVAHDADHRGVARLASPSASGRGGTGGRRRPAAPSPRAAR